MREYFHHTVHRKQGIVHHYVRNVCQQISIVLFETVKLLTSCHLSSDTVSLQATLEVVLLPTGEIWIGVPLVGGHYNYTSPAYFAQNFTLIPKLYLAGDRKSTCYRRGMLR